MPSFGKKLVPPTAAAVRRVAAPYKVQGNKFSANFVK